ncbi:hypothetical protein J1N35_037725 [Gossypium stocksii]|uniref:Uncharacterized protein n=1 Tax=Gossypium stocksii TaxID=47602 RepID=A0A9D3UKA8_9ROSI|nr:hypothetical protein J1N35_037725 [Gossypium stocksii]
MRADRPLAPFEVNRKAEAFSPRKGQYPRPLTAWDRFRRRRTGLRCRDPADAGVRSVRGARGGAACAEDDARR